MLLPRSTLAQAALAAALTTALYSIGLALSPPHLTHDEIKFAIQAQSIAESGRDINGRLLPLYFLEPGFSVGRDPICIYVTAAVLRLLPFSEQSVRFATTIVGGVSVALIFLLARLVFAGKATPWIVSGILALSPTYYIHSRLALSVLYPVPFTILWLIVLQAYWRQPRHRYALLAGVVLGLGVYSYLAAALMMPLYLGATVVAMAVRRDSRGATLAIGGFLVMLVPIALWQLVEPERYANILTAYRLYDHTSASPGSKVRELLSASSLASRINVFWDAFNPDRLFFTGESSVQISTREVGSLLTPIAALLAVGLWTIVRNARTPFGWLLLVGLLTAPVPAVIMADVEIRRWLTLLPFVAMISGYGVEWLLSRSVAGRVAAVALLLLMAVQFAVFTRDYFGPYRERASVWFGGNIRAAVQEVLEAARGEPPTAVYIAVEIPWVEAYWRFYSKVNGVDLLDRTRYISLGFDEMPRATAAAVIITPAPDPALAALLTEAGWTSQRIVADLDGRPSLLVARP